MILPFTYYTGLLNFCSLAADYVTHPTLFCSLSQHFYLGGTLEIKSKFQGTPA
jgi:hypothetical protein